jgi:hypothetical protein
MSTKKKPNVEVNLFFPDTSDNTKKREGVLTLLVYPLMVTKMYNSLIVENSF